MPANLHTLRTTAGQYRLIERFDITVPQGPSLFGTLWAVPHRRTGRRVQVHDAAGAELFDTDDQYDQGNAVHRLDAWLDGYIRALGPVAATPQPPAVPEDDDEPDDEATPLAEPETGNPVATRSK